LNKAKGKQPDAVTMVRQSYEYAGLPNH
jgi:hypothetical protein